MSAMGDQVSRSRLTATRHPVFKSHRVATGKVPEMIHRLGAMPLEVSLCGGFGNFRAAGLFDHALFVSRRLCTRVRHGNLRRLAREREGGSR